MKKQIRVHQIVIDSPRTELPPFVSMMVQRKIYDDDGNVSQIINRERQLNRRIDKVAFEMVTFTDPITQQSVTISIAGLGGALEATVAKWMAEDYADEVAHVDEAGKVWVG